MKENDTRLNFKRAGLNCSVTVTSETQGMLSDICFFVYEVELTLQSWYGSLKELPSTKGPRLSLIHVHPWVCMANWS